MDGFILIFRRDRISITLIDIYPVGVYAHPHEKEADVCTYG